MLYSKAEVINHRKMTDKEEETFLKHVAELIKNYLKSLPTNSRYFDLFTVEYVAGYMNGVDIIYKRDKDVQVSLGFDCDINIATHPSVREGVCGNYYKTLNGDNGFTYGEFINFLNRILKSLFVTGKVDEILYNEKRAKCFRQYGMDNVEIVQPPE